ncbi:ribonuclease P Rpr2/Rpp21/SNM1 subunit [Aspergillus vadensis CBS 113365]|uniref:Rpr2-domain-containing protein n=1 Tax=Aspergillus vadensis (strain CBS 113365 / IMI 142717 / IBT 24658) TaxID=1448311 RepID=A0A319BFZ5_ASPVC|nr:Rpr2-domain-containing protein [Aspergillus vadensis CBS 113365]PYH71101.1 Rpr2-domain-containing protein [Aspergillus vadensis CBS 113365]
MAKAKAKGKKDSAGGAQSHIRARIDYLYNAATFLQSIGKPSPQQPSVSQQNDQIDEAEDGAKFQETERIVPQMVESDVSPANDSTKPINPSTTKRLPQLSRVYMSQMRGVSLKSQLRLPIDVKRSFCKRCDTFLIPGVTCTQDIRNASRGRKKPWADVLVVCCSTCGTEKRFPQTDKRSKKLSERRKEAPKEEQKDEVMAGA